MNVVNIHSLSVNSGSAWDVYFTDENSKEMLFLCDQEMDSGGRGVEEACECLLRLL